MTTPDFVVDRPGGWLLTMLAQMANVVTGTINEGHDVVENQALWCEGFDGPCIEGIGTRRTCATAYADPRENVDPYLCDADAVLYYEYWTRMWDEYYAGRL